MDHAFIPTNGITLHTVMAGPEDGPLVILLHGFPEFWYGWRRQIPALAAAGFRVWAPDQRGYNLSDRPRALSAYSIDKLAADAVGLIDASGRERVYLVGHDWGAMVAWWVALTAPHRLHRLAILNVPHPTVARRRFSRDPRQMVRSLYALYFQLPWLPEAMMSAGNWRALANALRGSSRPGAFSDEDLAEYRQAWSRPGAMTAMLNWYRAFLRRPAADWSDPRVVVPTTVIWGMKDFALRGVMAAESAAQCDDADLIQLPDNTHWVQHEAADLVNETLIARFGQKK
jgi:pimeloyl-ACP methyl ester carboxylesterase